MASVRKPSLSAALPDLLDSLYAASTDPARWQNFMDRVSYWFNCGTALALVPTADSSGTFLLGGTLEPEKMREHNEHYASVCPWIGRLGTAHPVLDLSEALIPDQEMVRTEYYNDWLKPQGWQHWAHIRPNLGPEHWLGLGIARSSRFGHYAADEQRLLIELSSHLGRAGEVSRRLELFEAQTRAGSRVLADLGAAVLLADAQGRIVFANPTAEELLLVGDGLTIRGGRLRPSSPRLEPTLRDALERATGGVSGERGPATTLRCERRWGPAPLTLTITPLSEGDHPGLALSPLALVVIGVPESDAAIDPERLRAAHDLTAAEARLVVALCAGRSLADYAEEAGISLNTAKFHLKAVFDKTGETRQPDLIRSVMANAALRRGAD